ncbi:MAG: hypothetical protein SFT91_04240 [Rickettsiaceae bacterium]|nr:hypothetical protein [Rickettsiaceae bacterium]
MSPLIHLNQKYEDVIYSPRISDSIENFCVTINDAPSEYIVCAGSSPDYSSIEKFTE